MSSSVERFNYESYDSTTSRSVTFRFNNEVTYKDLAALRTMILADHYSHAFDIFIINKNTTFDEDEFLTTFLENVLVIPPQTPVHITRRGRSDDDDELSTTAEFAIKIRGPRLATTDDILTTERSFGYSIVRNQPLFYVRENEEVDITMLTKYSNGRDHTKFRVAEEVFVDPRINIIRIETTSVTTPQIVMDWAIENYTPLTD